MPVAMVLVCDEYTNNKKYNTSSAKTGYWAKKSVKTTEVLKMSTLKCKTVLNVYVYE